VRVGARVRVRVGVRARVRVGVRVRVRARVWTRVGNYTLPRIQPLTPTPTPGQVRLRGPPAHGGA